MQQKGTKQGRNAQNNICNLGSAAKKIEQQKEK